jgi:hypothetical protein
MGILAIMLWCPAFYCVLRLIKGKNKGLGPVPVVKLAVTLLGASMVIVQLFHDANVQFVQLTNVYPAAGSADKITVLPEVYAEPQSGGVVTVMVPPPVGFTNVPSAKQSEPLPCAGTGPRILFASETSATYPYVLLQ